MFQFWPVSADWGCGLSETELSWSHWLISNMFKDFFFLIHRSTKLVIIERLLLLAERYVITIEVCSLLYRATLFMLWDEVGEACVLTRLVVPQCIWRSWLISLKDFYSVPRTILPHGASFHGHLLTLNVTYESTKDTFAVEVSLY